MERGRPARTLKRKLAPCVGSIEAYNEASSPSKHNSIYGCKDEDFLKEIFVIEKNHAWREMCVERIHDDAFLEFAAKTDYNDRVRLKAAKRCKKIALIEWLKDNDPHENIRKYALDRYNLLDNSLKFIVS